MPKERWLEYYSRHFTGVEINASYYAVPKQQNVARWAEVTPDDFHFLVKLHGESTHKRQHEGREVEELLAALEPLREAGKLKGLLAQFPASFHYGEEELRYLARLAERCGHIPLFVEFRHVSWDREDVVSFCSEQGLGYVAVDLPPIRSLMPPRPAVSGSLGYVRMHGRNARTWYQKELGDRYDWDYSRRELIQWIPRLKALTQRCELAYLFFNNCHAGQAIKNAMLMRELLQREMDIR